MAQTRQNASEIKPGNTNYKTCQIWSNNKIKINNKMYKNQVKINNTLKSVKTKKTSGVQEEL